MIDRVNSEKSLRILIATHAPLSLEFGAGQVAINLAAAFRNKGHQVTIWSSQPLVPSKFNLLAWSQHIRAARKKIDVFLTSENAFDLIDCPSIYISRQVVRSGAVVVSRSVQPDILYLIHDLTQVKNWQHLVKKPLYLMDICIYIFYLIQGWHRADWILCLGSLEINWMQKKFPWLGKKLNYYVNTPASDEQVELRKIRSQRQQMASQSIKFLWIGRWSSQKGIKDLIDFILASTNLRPDDSFTIAGCGDDAARDIPIQLIESGCLKLIPTFSRQDLYSLLREHQVGLFTSKTEGWGLVLNEMLESGMTVYAASAGGVPDLHHYFPEMLKVFPPPVDIIISNPQSCDWQRYYQQFTWDRIAELYLKIHQLE